MPSPGSSSRIRRFAGIAAALLLIAFGVAAVVQGLAGHSTVRDALALERVSGEAGMTPTGIAAKARAAGLHGVELPTCSVQGKPVDDGAAARCFAQYMRIDALIATGGKTYAQMPRYASKDGKGTDELASAITFPNGVGMPNPARNVWITETALTTALNTSYMAEQISLFGIAVGGAFLLLGLVLAGLSLSRVPAVRAATVRATDRTPAVAVS